MSHSHPAGAASNTPLGAWCHPPAAPCWFHTPFQASASKFLGSAASIWAMASWACR